MAWPNPGPAPVWPPPAEEGWYRFEASEYGRSVGARTETGSTSFSGPPGGWAAGRLSEDNSGKAIYSDGGGGGMTYADKALGCFDVPAEMLAALPVAGAVVTAVSDNYARRLYARVTASPAAWGHYTGEPLRRIPVPTGRPESERAAWEAEVAAWCAAYERAIREAFEAFSASEAAKVAAKQQAELAALTRHGTPAPAPWHCYGVEAAEVVAAHPSLITGMGVSPCADGSSHVPRLMPGDMAMLALRSEISGGKRYSCRVNWDRTTGVRQLSCDSYRHWFLLVAAVEPGFRVVVEYLRDGQVQWSRAWDASGEQDVSAPMPAAPAAGFGTLASLLAR